MFSAKVAGQWLDTIGEFGPITVEYGEHGPELASWQMDPRLRHSSLRGNVPVDIYDGAFPIWAGNLVEPGSDGQMIARGAWHQAEGLYPLDATGNLISNVDVALFHAIITRAQLPWTQPISIMNTNWSTDPSNLTLVALFDGYAAETGMRWFVNARRQILFAADPTVPQWVVPHAVAGRGLTPAEDEFFTHLDGRYRDSGAGGVYKSVTVGSAEAATVFGIKTDLIDLSDLGSTTAARATTVLQGIQLKSGARMGWGEGLELGRGQITNPGGEPAPFNQIESLQMVRLAGTVDTSRAYLMRANTDIVLKGVRYTDGAPTISLTPMGYAPRNYADMQKEAMAQR